MKHERKKLMALMIKSEEEALDILDENDELFIKMICETESKESIARRFLQEMSINHIHKIFNMSIHPYTVQGAKVYWLEQKLSEFLFKELTALKFIDCEKKLWDFVIDGEVIKEMLTMQYRRFWTRGTTDFWETYKKVKIPQINWLGSSRQLLFLARFLSPSKKDRDEMGWKIHLKKREQFLAKCFLVDGERISKDNVAPQVYYEKKDIHNDPISNIIDKIERNF